MATLALVKWHEGSQQQPAASGMAGHVGWHELLAVSWEKAFAFYSELFGWQKVDADAGGIGKYQLFAAAGRPTGGRAPQPPGGGAPVRLYHFHLRGLAAGAPLRVTAG